MLASNHAEYYIDYWLSHAGGRVAGVDPDNSVVSLLTRPDFFRAPPLTSRIFVKAFTSEMSCRGDLVLSERLHCLLTRRRSGWRYRRR